MTRWMPLGSDSTGRQATRLGLEMFDLGLKEAALYEQQRHLAALQAEQAAVEGPFLAARRPTSQLSTAVSG